MSAQNVHMWGIAVICIVGWGALLVTLAVLWVTHDPDDPVDTDEAAGMIIATFAGIALAALLWPVIVVGGPIVYGLWRLRRRLHPRLKIPADDLRVRS